MKKKMLVIGAVAAGTSAAAKARRVDPELEIKEDKLLYQDH